MIYRDDRVERSRLEAIVDQSLLSLSWAETIWLPTGEEQPGHSQVQDAIRQGATEIIVVRSEEPHV